MSQPLPFPGDVVIVVAALKSDSTCNEILQEHEATCLHCHQKVIAKANVVEQARTIAAQKGQVVGFFCPKCCELYDWRSDEVIVEI